MEQKNVKIPVEQFLLGQYDEEIVYALLRADNAGWCELSDEFVASVYARGSEKLRAFVKEHAYLVSDLVLDEIFAAKDALYLKEYLNKTQGRNMQPRHIVALIELGYQELIDHFFALNAPIIWSDSLYEPVIRFLQEKQLNAKYRRKYLPSRVFSR